MTDKNSDRRDHLRNLERKLDEIEGRVSGLTKRLSGEAKDSFECFAKLAPSCVERGPMGGTERHAANFWQAINPQAKKSAPRIVCHHCNDALFERGGKGSDVRYRSMPLRLAFYRERTRLTEELESVSGQIERVRREIKDQEQVEKERAALDRAAEEFFGELDDDTSSESRVLH